MMINNNNNRVNNNHMRNSFHNNKKILIIITAVLEFREVKINNNKKINKARTVLWKKKRELQQKT